MFPELSIKRPKKLYGEGWWFSPYDYDVRISILESVINEVSQLIEVDYAELFFKMDKFMPEFVGVMDEYESIISASTSMEEKFDQLYFFLEEFADQEIMSLYMPVNGNLAGLTTYIINQKSL